MEKEERKNPPIVIWITGPNENEWKWNTGKRIDNENPHGKHALVYDFDFAIWNVFFFFSLHRRENAIFFTQPTIDGKNFILLNIFLRFFLLSTMCCRRRRQRRQFNVFFSFFRFISFVKELNGMFRIADTQESHLIINYIFADKRFCCWWCVSGRRSYFELDKMKTI